MLFNSSQLGTVDIDEDTIITFSSGIPALENCTRFKLFHNAEAEQGAPSVYWMQSLDVADITFSLTTPADLGIHYDIVLDDDEVALLELAGPEDAAILVMLYRQDNQPDSTSAERQLNANLANPLVINTQSRKGLQKTGIVSQAA